MIEAVDPSIDIDREQFTARILRVYMACLLLFVGLSVLNNLAQIGSSSSFVAQRSLLNLSLVSGMLAATFWFARRGQLAQAVSILITAFLLFPAATALLHGMGVRAPIMGLMVLGIGLAHFQFGRRIAGGVTALCCAIVAVGWVAETQDWVPGTTGQHFPPSINALVMLMTVLSLGYLTAVEMQARSEFSLRAIEKQNDTLQASIDLTRQNQAAQDLFFSQVTPDLLAECDRLADLCNRLADPDLPDHDRKLLLEEVRVLNSAVVSRFEQAVSVVEKAD